MFSNLIAHFCSSECSGLLIECGCVYFVFLVGAGKEAKYQWFRQGCNSQGSPNWGVSLFPQVWSKWWVNISIACRLHVWAIASGSLAIEELVEVVLNWPSATQYSRNSCLYIFDLLWMLDKFYMLDRLTCVCFIRMLDRLKCILMRISVWKALRGFLWVLCEHILD